MRTDVRACPPAVRHDVLLPTVPNLLPYPSTSQEPQHLQPAVIPSDVPMEDQSGGYESAAGGDFSVNMADGDADLVEGMKPGREDSDMTDDDSAQGGEGTRVFRLPRGWWHLSRS